ncbi:MAG: PIN domain-containing protein [Actinomycetota bacterium]
MRTNFVLVDLENVQPKNIGLLYGGPFKIKVFLGATQCKIPLDMARALQAFGPDVEYIQMDGNGTNALDFHIAYYIGRLAAGYPDACFRLGGKGGL